MGDPAPADADRRHRPVLAGDTVRYVGEPIAVIVADDASIARDAAERVEIDFTPLDGVGQRAGREPSKNAPVLHASIGSNVAGEVKSSRFGDSPAAFADAPTVVRLRGPTGTRHRRLHGTARGPPPA